MVRKSLRLLAVFLIPAVFSLLMLGGCTDSSGASAGKIAPPSGSSSPFTGKWTVRQELGEKSGKADKAPQWVGSSVQFAADAISFGGNVWDKLSYKIKRVNEADYLMTKYITPSDLSAPDAREVDVITVYAAGNFLGEFMKIDDADMIFFVQDRELLLKKVSDQADSMPGAANPDVGDLNQESGEGASGVLLGLRIPSGTGYVYRTLWIAADQHQLHPVLESEQLFFPRTSGFWELSVRNLSSGGKTSNVLTARNVAAKTLEMKTARNGKDAKGRQEVQDSSNAAVSVINYIGNDYVAVEKRTGDVNRLQMLPVDKLLSPTEIKISDLLGKKGSDAYFRARERAVEVLKGKGVTSVDSDEYGENFGLVRKNGHWFLVGRINYQSGRNQEQTDFELKVVPPAGLIFYDTLVLSWHTIKDKVPDALDAFTSPNKDIVLVRTKNKLAVYKIGAEQLEDNPLAELDLQEGTAVIMAEWATGSYVDSWEKSFLSYGAETVSGSALRVR